MDQINKWIIIDSVLFASLVIIWYWRHLTLSRVIDFLSSWTVLIIIVAIVLLAWVACMIIWEAIGFVVRKLFRNDHLFTKMPKRELFVISFILVIFYGMTNTCMCGSRSKARDARRMSDMRQIVSAQETYFSETGKYYQSKLLPVAIEDASSSDSFVVPADPGSANYHWIDNSGEGAKFCAYAVLENVSTSATNCSSGCKYYVATGDGYFYKAEEPNNLYNCSGITI